MPSRYRVALRRAPAPPLHGRAPSLTGARAARFVARSVLANRSPELRKVITVVLRECTAGVSAMPLTRVSVGGTAPRSAQVIDHARIDVRSDDGEVGRVARARVRRARQSPPTADSFRGGPASEETGARREVEPGADNQHAPDLRAGIQRLQNAETVVDDVTRLDGRVGAEPACAIQLGHGIRPGALRDELLVVNESHRARVLADQRRFPSRCVGKGRLQERRGNMLSRGSGRAQNSIAFNRSRRRGTTSAGNVVSRVDEAFALSAGSIGARL